MTLLFFLMALVVGVVTGLAIGYETRDLRNQPTGLRPWLTFVGVAAVVAACSAVVSWINETDAPSTQAKGLSILSGAATFCVALYLARKKGRVEHEAVE